MSATEEVERALSEDHGYEGPKDVTDTPVNLHANLKVNKRDGDEGVLLESREVKNIITNDGADAVRTAVGSAALTSVFKWIGVGTSANAFTSTDSQLNTEIASSESNYFTTGNFGQFSRKTTFTNIGPTTVRESGLFNRDGINSGSMLAAQTFGQVEMASGDKLEVIWKVYFSQ